MYLFCSSFFPVSRTFSALMTTTKSPVSTCGVKIVFSFPRNKLAAFTATWPSTWFLASITHHLREISLALAEKVFITAEKARKLRDVLWSVKYSRELRPALSTLFGVVGFSPLSTSEYPAAPRGKGISADNVIGDRGYRAARVLWQRLYYQFCQASTPPNEFLTAGSKWLLVICIVGVQLFPSSHGRTRKFFQENRDYAAARRRFS